MRTAGIPLEMSYLEPSGHTIRYRNRDLDAPREDLRRHWDLTIDQIAALHNLGAAPSLDDVTSDADLIAKYHPESP
ncbi:MAG: hypothetical protein M3Y07_10455 [Acidobacteriota bacterium]|nr:hypothetical protein [Acidobacteriota bacterium]